MLRAPLISCIIIIISCIISFVGSFISNKHHEVMIYLIIIAVVLETFAFLLLFFNNYQTWVYLKSRPNLTEETEEEMTSEMRVNSV